MVSCAFIGYDRVRLNIVKRDQTNNIQRLNLRIHGVYRSSDGNGINFVLYNNGVFLSLGTNPDEIVRYSEDRSFMNFIGNEGLYSWGVYELRGDTIEYELWMPDGGWLFPDGSLKYTGIVADSVTIVFSKEMNNHRKLANRLREDRIYRFLPLKDKPDSVNRFIK